VEERIVSPKEETSPDATTVLFGVEPRSAAKVDAALGHPNRGSRDRLQIRQLVEKGGERGRNRTFNLLIKSWFSRTRLTAASDQTNQRLTFTNARTEALDKSCEKGRMAHIGSRRTAHLRHTYMG